MKPKQPAAPPRAELSARLLSLALLAAIVGAAALPLLRPYQVAGHSAYVDLARAAAFHEAMEHGLHAPRWIVDFYSRLGSPIFNFYAPLTYYVIEFFRQLGLDGMWSLKAAYLFFWAMAAAGMFLFAGDAIDWAGGLAAAAAYATAPYLLVDIYVRNGVAEFAGFAWLPWTLWGLWRAVRGKGRFGPLAAALGYAGLILSHNITAMIASPFLWATVVLGAADWRRALRGAAALTIGLGIGSVFWLPALLEMKYVQATPSLTGGFFDFRRHFLSLGQLFERRWNYGSSQVGPDGMGFMLGEAMWVGIAVSLASLLTPSLRIRHAARRLLLLLAGGALACLFMTLPLSRPLWPRLPLLPFVQFPWRFLLPATFFAAAGLAFLPRLAPEKWRLTAALALALAAAGASAQYFQARYVFQDIERNGFAFVGAEHASQASLAPNLKRPDEFLTIETIRALGVNTTASHDYLPVFCRRLPEAPATAAEPGDDQVKVVWSRWDYPAGVSAEAVATVQQDVVLNQFFFPGWEAEVDGDPTPVKTEPESGRMIVTIGPGRHLIQARFADTLPRLAGKLIGAASLLTLLLWAWFVLRHERE